MHNVPFLFIVLRKLTFLALTGFLGVMLIGPVLAVLGVVVSFAVIGMLFWMPIRVLLLGKPPEWRRYRDMTRKYGGAVLNSWNRLGGGVLDHRPDVLERVCAEARILATILREIICGALVGALLGLTQPSPLGPAIVGLIGGAVFGALVGLTSGRRLSETACHG